MDWITPSIISGAVLAGSRDSQFDQPKTATAAISHEVGLKLMATPGIGGM